MPHIRQSIPLELRSTPSGIIEGYASVYGVQDLLGDVVQPGAFAKTITTHTAAGTRPAMLWAHDQSRVVGQWSSISDDGRGLLVRGQLNLKTIEGREAFASVEAGDLDGLSIGFFVPPNGSKYQAGANLLTEIELHEISLVSCPANQAARITSVKSLPSKPKTLREFESALRELGFSRAEAVAIAKNGFTEAEKAEEADLVNQLAELIKLI